MIPSPKSLGRAPRPLGHSLRCARPDDRWSRLRRAAQPHAALSRRSNVEYPWKIALEDLEQRSGTHATADAHRDHPIFRSAAPALQKQMPGHTCTAHSIRVADRYGAPGHIETIIGDPEPIS